MTEITINSIFTKLNEINNKILKYLEFIVIYSKYFKNMLFTSIITKNYYLFVSDPDEVC